MNERKYLKRQLLFCILKQLLLALCALRIYLTNVILGLAGPATCRRSSSRRPTPRPRTCRGTTTSTKRRRWRSTPGTRWSRSSWGGSRTTPRTPRPRTWLSWCSTLPHSGKHQIRVMWRDTQVDTKWRVTTWSPARCDIVLFHLVPPTSAYDEYGHERH